MEAESITSYQLQDLIAQDWTTGPEGLWVAAGWLVIMRRGQEKRAVIVTDAV
jgi:hypothetical protein